LSEAVVQEKTPFEKFIEGYNQDYVMKCKDLGLKNEYEIEVNGKPVTFIRKRLTTKQFNDLEQIRNKADKETTEDSMANAQRTANVYFEIGKAYLTNKDTGQPITKEEYENSIWEDIKLVLDACHLRTMIGVPNAATASKT
jgi:hypothetical protein